MDFSPDYSVMKKGLSLIGERILDVFFIMLVITRVWFCIIDFIIQGAFSGVLSTLMGIFQIYLAYLLKGRNEWALWIFRILGIVHLLFLPTRFLMQPIYIYLIIFDIFYIVSAIVFSIFMKNIICYIDRDEQ